MTTTNGTMLQAFSWNLPADKKHWKRLAHAAAEFEHEGITAVWMPPAYKGQAGVDDQGYGVYDLYDLGEFDQRGTVATKYGTKEEYLEAIEALQKRGINVLGDVVLNHRMGADEAEEVLVVPMDPNNRWQPLVEEPPAEEPEADEPTPEVPVEDEDAGEKDEAAPDDAADAPVVDDAVEPDGPSPIPIKAWTRFTFPGRGDTYSNFTWDKSCFKAADYGEGVPDGGVYLFDGKRWDEDVDGEMGNYDYLMGVDVDVSDEHVYQELLAWGKWYLSTCGLDGFRLDAIKHISRRFFRRWLKDLREWSGKELFCVGEYWNGSVDTLRGYLGTGEEDDPIMMSLFDVPLHFKLHAASNSMGAQDLSQLFDGTLVSQDPVHAVTFVDNHDTQPHQSLESPVELWFKPSAYAFILLRQDGYPCVFYGDLYGMPDSGLPEVAELPLLMEIRRRHAYGEQHDHIDHPNVVGWTREGDEEHEGSGLAVVLSDSEGGEKTMYVGESHAGETWSCVIGEEDDVVIGDDGQATFRTGDGKLSVYVRADQATHLEHDRILRHSVHKQAHMTGAHISQIVPAEVPEEAAAIE